jgi:hypothetical protein
LEHGAERVVRQVKRDNFIRHNKGGTKIFRQICVWLLLFAFAADGIGVGTGLERVVSPARRYSANTQISLDTSNRDMLSQQRLEATLTRPSDTDKVVAIRLVSMTDESKQYDIYSVRYGDTDYYCNGGTYEGDASTAGLYYQDGWKFVAPDAFETSTSLSISYVTDTRNATSMRHVQVFAGSTATVTATTAGDGVESAYAAAVAEALKSAAATGTGLFLKYKDYNGENHTASYQATGATSAEQISYNALTTSFVKQTEQIAYYNLCYGNGVFQYMDGTAEMIGIYCHDKLKAEVKRKPQSNCFVLDTSESAQAYCYFDSYYAPEQNYYTTSWSDGSSSDPITVNESDWTLSGGALKMPDEGLYLPGRTSTGGVGYGIKGNFGAISAGQSVATELADYEWYGPASSDLGTVAVNHSAAITDGLKDIRGAASDYAGTVIKVNDTAVTEAKPYSDAYVQITADGKVTVLKESSKALSYTVVTQTKYTRLKTYTVRENNDIVEKLIRYDDGSESGSETFANQYGTQDWKIALVLSTPKPKDEDADDTDSKTETTKDDNTKKTSTDKDGDGILDSQQPSAISSSVGKVTQCKARRKGRHKIKLTWKKVSKASGYIIYYKTSRSGKFRKLTTISKNRASYTKKIKNKKQTYYFKVQAYRKNGQKRLYGAYSKTFKVTCKKR